MSILDFPRLHFQGFARAHAPTGHKNGLVDLSNNTVYMNGDRFDTTRPPLDFHEYLQKIGQNYNAQGKLDDDGAFNTAMGWDFGGNGHFSIEAKIVSTQKEFAKIEQHDPVIGRSVDVWGHYNEYVKTSFNRARIFECDPASNWTSTIMLGQLTFGRQGASSEVSNMLTAPIEGMQLARWQDFNHIRNLPEHILNNEFKKACLYQFAVSKDDKDFLWGDEVEFSPTVFLLKEAMKRDDVLGLVVQMGISNMSTPIQPDSPVFYELHGTIGLWCRDELKTYPAGRLLIPVNNCGNRQEAKDAKEESKISNLTLQITPQGVSLNMVNAIPCVGREVEAGPGPTHKIQGKLDLGELELRTLKSQKLIAKISRELYDFKAHQLKSGLVDVPFAFNLTESVDDYRDIENYIQQEGLCIIGRDANGKEKILLEEQEINIQVDDGCLFVESPDSRKGNDNSVELEICSFVRGIPASVETVYIQQFYNPKAFPQLLYDSEDNDQNNFEKIKFNLEEEKENEKGNENKNNFHFPRNSELRVVQFKKGKQGEIEEFSQNFTSSCVISTDERGRGWITLRGDRPGTTKVLLTSSLDILPCDLTNPDEAVISYDNEDKLGFWSKYGFFGVRVMSDDWDLENIPEEKVDFNLVYEHILAFYELCFSFMKVEVFSLSDQCKVETYARLVWQMSDPKNKSKTYYMPPTRDMSQAKATLLRKFLLNQQKIGYIPNPIQEPKQTQHTIETREELVSALKQAAEIEVAVMLQYVYAGYSIPNYVTGQEYVRRGLWTQQQLDLACGDGKESYDYGMRGTLIEVSREEMIHFLLVNNILMAIGEPFYPAIPNFSNINERIPIETDFALEPLNTSSLQRFIKFETPDFLETNLVNESISQNSNPERIHRYSSLSELYRQIRNGLEKVPDLFVVKKGTTGGEHRLFMRQDFNVVHPDYQMQVDDLKSALFAIDLIVEQGEGCNASSPKFDQSHYQRFRRMADALAKEQMHDINSKSHNRGLPWNPAYPGLRNPTLHHQNYNNTVVTIPQTRAVMQIFDECYFIMMQLMVQHFGLTPNGSLRRSKLMNAGIDVMTGMMRPLGELLMTLPSGKYGQTAGPAFEITSPIYIPNPEVACQMISKRFENLSHQARECQVIHSTVYQMFDFYAHFFSDLAKNPQQLLQH